MKLLLRHHLDFTEAELKKFKDNNIEVLDYDRSKTQDADILVGFVNAPFDELDNMKSLKFVQSLKVGYEGLDLNRFKEKGVVFANARGVASNIIAEHVLSRMLSHTKEHRYYYELQQNHVWTREDRSMNELTGQTLLIFGTGHIGQEIAKRAQAFEMNVIGVNSNGRDIDCFNQCYTLDSYHEVIASVDMVVGCLPSNEATLGMFNHEFFKQLKDGVLFINVGRGNQVNEDDLLNALDDNIGYAYLDVTVEEPLLEDSLLWNHPRLELTPHIASRSIQTEERTRKLVIENACLFSEGHDVKQRVI